MSAAGKEKLRQREPEQRGASLAARLVREPLVHFLLIGAGLFLLFGWRGGPPSLPGGQGGLQLMRIVVTQGDVKQLVETFTRTWQRPPTAQELKALTEDLVRNEIYYREALAIGLDRDDGVIRRRMRQKMEFILEDITAQVEPTEEDLLLFIKKNPERYRVDPQIAFRHVYVDAGKRGRKTEADARRILAQLTAGVDYATVGDSVLLESEISLAPLWDIENRFGEAFGRSLLELKPGRWEGPVRSGFGLHLVYVMKRVGGRLPELHEVREIVKQDWAAARQMELKDAAYARLRERYTVVVEMPETMASSDAAAARAVMVTP